MSPLSMTDKLITQNCTNKIVDYNQPLYKHGWMKIFYILFLPKTFSTASKKLFFGIFPK